MTTEHGNRFISEALSNDTVILDEVVKICDLGDTLIQLNVHTDQRIITLGMPSIETLGKLGLKDYLKQIYPGTDIESTDDGIVVKDRNQIGGGELSLLRLHCLGYPIMLCIHAMQAGT